MAHRPRRFGASLGLAPFLLYVGFFLIVPTVVVFIHAFQTNETPATFSLDAINQLKESATLKITKDTVILSVTTALIGAVVGSVVAYVVSTARPDGVLRRFVTSTCGVLAQFGGVALAFAFIATIGNTGVVTQWLNLTDTSWLFTLKGSTLR